MRTKGNIKDLYGLSPMQEGMLFHALLEPNSSAYFNQICHHLDGLLDLKRAQQAFQQLIDRHDILRTNFLHEGISKPVQVVLKQRTADVRLIDLAPLPPHQQHTALQHHLQQDRHRGFVLDKDPLIRLTLIQLHSHHALLWTHHHILFDGWCAHQLQHEFDHLYHASTNPQLPPLPPPPPFRPYIDFINQLDTTHTLAFWQTYLQAVSQPTPLPWPTAHPTQPGQPAPTYLPQECSLLLSPQLTGQLEALARQQHTTLSSLLQVAWGLLLARYNDTHHATFGLVVSGRPPHLPGIEAMLGLCINTIPQHIAFDQQQPVSQLLAHHQQAFAHTQPHHYAPLAQVLAQSPLRQALFEHILIVENLPANDHNLPNSHDEPTDVPHNVPADQPDNNTSFGFAQTNYPLNLIAFPGQQLQLRFSFDANRYQPQHLHQTAQHLQHLLQQIANDPHQPIGQLQLLTPLEEQHLRLGGSPPQPAYDLATPLPHLVRQLARQHPHAIAVTLHDQHWTFHQLITHAQGLARHLLTTYPHLHQQPIALLAQPSPQRIAALLAILLAGGVLLPIDPDTPSQRLAHLLSEAQATLVLTDQAGLALLPPHRQHLRIDLPLPTNSVPAPATNVPHADDQPWPLIQPHHLAYLLFTSGTTGQPKAVAVTHHSLLLRTKDHIDFLRLNPHDTLLQFSSPAFDASLIETAMALLTPARLLLLPPTTRTHLPHLLAYLHHHQPTTAILPPAILRLLADHPLPPSLHTIISTGEAAHLPTSLQLAHHHRLVNGYGPTECCIGACFHALDPARADDYQQSGQLPIGRPFAHTPLFVLDQHQRLLPLGLPGELYVGGPGLAKGYWQQPELTAQRFVQSPFEAHQRLYRTGDRVRWNAQGELEYLGRLDQQVQLRGIRVEPAEVEAQLLAQPTVAQAACVPHPDGQHLLAFVTALDPASPPDPRHLRQQLTDHLPPYMLPAQLLVVTNWPLTPNGKLDRQALLTLAQEDQQADADLPEPPLGEAEQRLGLVWQAVLGLAAVGRHSDFFASGGDSIKAIQIAARLHQQGFQLELKDLFRYPLLHQQAQQVSPLRQTNDQQPFSGPGRMSPIQRAYFQLTNRPAAAFRLRLLLELPGHFDESAVQALLTPLLVQHDMLRTSFVRVADADSDDFAISLAEGGYIRQQTLPQQPLPLAVHSLDQLPADEAQQVAQRILFDEQQQPEPPDGPLWQASLLVLPGRRVLSLSIHHLAIDAVGWRILTGDLNLLYAQYVGGQRLQLPPKTHAYAHWTQALHEQVQHPGFLGQRTYWLNLVQQARQLAPLPQQPQPGTHHPVGQRTQMWSTAHTQRLRTATTAYTTHTGDLLLTALLRTLHRWHPQPAWLLHQEGHGRQGFREGPAADINLTRTVGWCTNLYPLLIRVADHWSVGRWVQEVKEQQRAVPDAGQGYGLLRYLATNGLEIALNPALGFNYLGEFDQSAATSDDATSDSLMLREASVNEPTGTEPPDVLLEEGLLLRVSGSIVNGQLQLHWHYRTTAFNDQLVADWCQQLERQLEQVVEHCLAQSERRLTPSDLGYAKLTIDELADFTALYAIKDIYGLSPMQQGMLFHALLEPDSSAYLNQACYHLHSPIDPHRAQLAFQQLIDRHDVLRTVFNHHKADRPLQVVLKQRTADFRRIDLTTLPPHHQHTALQHHLKEDRRRGFALDKDPLIRLTLFQLHDHHALLWTHHHILFDGWCAHQLQHEFDHLYHATNNPQLPPLPPPTPFRPYIDFINQLDTTHTLAFWQTYLQAVTQPTPLPWPHANPTQPNQPAPPYLPQESSLTLSPQLTQQLEALARQQHTTLSSLLQVAWGLLLARYNDTHHATFGLVVSGRPPHLPGIEAMLGLCINTIPQHIAFDQQQPISHLLAHHQQAFALTQPHHYAPLAQVLAQSPLRQALFEHILIVENRPQEAPGASAENELVEQLTADHVDAFEQTNYDFTLTVSPGDAIQFRAGFNANVYREADVQQTLGHLTYLLEQIVTGIDEPAGTLQIVTPPERQQLIAGFNQTAVAYDKHCIHELFEQQVARTPQAIAIIFEDKRLTYQHVDDRANELADYLTRQRQIKPNELVGLMIDRSDWLIISILGILKAKAAYVPLDPAIPLARLAYIVADTQLPLLLADQNNIALCGQLCQLGKHVPRTAFINTESLGFELIEKPNPNVDESPGLVYATAFTAHAQLEETRTPTSALAYILYTSGSTGKPKGVAITHDSVCNFLHSMGQQPGINPTDKLLAVTTYTFDISVLELFLPLVNGATVLLTSQQTLHNWSRLQEVMADEQPTIMQATPTLWQALINSGWEGSPSLKILCGGEHLNAELAAQLLERGSSVWNMYGPTETTIWSTTTELTNAKAVTIGQPIANTQVYVLDQHQRLLPQGLPGELYVGGTGLALGYWQQPQLTHQRFVPSPFDPSQRLYRTGDRVRWNHHGQLEYLGRLDHQLKIRGFRIEPAEVEAQLLAQPTVAQAACLPHPDGQHLLAFITALDPASPPDPQHLRQQLADQLPPYMIPSQVRLVNHWPLTPNGKLDRAALLTLAQEDQQADADTLEPPLGESEQRLAQVWQGVLGLTAVGRHSDFFASGGDSIKAIQIAARLHQQGVQLELKDLFRYPLLHQQAQCLTQRQDTTLATPTTPQQWLHHWQQQRQQSSLLGQRTYWLTLVQQARQLPSLLQQPQPGTHHPEGQRTQTWTPAHTQRLLEANAAYTTHTADLLLTALLRTLHHWQPQPAWLLTRQATLPPSLAGLGELLGWQPGAFPLLVQVAQDWSVGRWVQEVKEQQRAVPDEGRGYAPLRHLTDAGAELVLSPPMGFAYREEDGEPLPGLGTLAEDQWLQVSGQLVSGQLQLHWHYQPAAFAHQLIEYWGQQMEQQLEQLVDHCLSQTESQLTPSDLGYAELTIDQFETFFE